MTTLTLHHTEQFQRTVRIEPITALPGQFCVVIESRLLTARNPDAVQRNLQMLVTREQLQDLASLIAQTLAD